MRRYLTIDGGTTNTRVALVEDGTLRDTLRLSAGAGNTTRGDMEKLLGQAVQEMFYRHSLGKADITAVLASGMITSEKGVCQLPHTTAPAGAAQLHERMRSVLLPAVAPIPITFISGVRQMGDDLRQWDMMRGEETELLGLMQLLGTEGKPCVYVLPGSHSKIIRTDTVGRIIGFSTMLTGEMIAALANHTILRDAVDLTLAETQQTSLLDGYEYAAGRGLNEALFKVRVMQTQQNAPPVQTYSFFLGAVLSGEIGRILETPGDAVVLGGKRSLRQPMQAILAHCADRPVQCVTDEQANAAAPLGMIRVYEYTP